MAGIERLTTANVALANRLDYWNRVTDETYAGTTVDQRDQVFEAEMLRWRLGNLNMIRPRASAAQVTRRPVSSGGPESILLHFQHRGRGRHEQCGRIADMSAGDFSLCRASAPYRLDLEAHEFIVIEMPRALLDDRIDKLDDAMSRRIPGSSGSGQLLHNFFLTLWQQGDQSTVDPNWQQDVADILLDLIALAVRGADNSPLGPHAHRDRALKFIEAGLTDPELSSAHIAAELGVSIRTVQNIFAAMGTTPGGHILARRLARATEMLTLHPAMSITDVAFELGFSESSYFTRCFRQNFGMTPSHWRKQR